MSGHSQIANVLASGEFRNLRNDTNLQPSHIANMTETTDKNGGPNHLGAWMRYRNMKGADLAKQIDITPGMVSDLVNSHRALSAKWLRRLAPALKITPGFLLDHDPYSLPADIIEIWTVADDRQRRQISKIAEAIVRDGTDG